MNVGVGRVPAGRGLRRPPLSVVVCGAGTVALATACQQPGQVPLAATDSTPPPPATVSFSVADGAKGVRPDAAMKATVSDGDLVTARLTGPKGALVPGVVRDGSWVASARLKPDTQYTFTATGKGADGVPRSAAATFTTLRPKVTATYWVGPGEQSVGVGMPVMVTFDSAVADRMRAEVEKRMTITTTPAQKGSWGWVDNRQLMYRPATYWKPGTKVSVSAPLTGVQTGDEKWVAEDKGTAFTVANRSRISTVDLARHVMTVRENGKIVGTYPISGGRPTASWETRSGIKIITEKRAHYVMDAATLGLDENDPNYYRTEVRHAMRVTNTGEFLHGAPWSVWAQGRRNVSHGCVNLGPRDAREVFNESLVGDVVDFVGSSRKMKPGDGVPVWLFSFAEWQAKSALAAPAPKRPAPTASGATPSAGASSASGSASAPAAGTPTTTLATDGVRTATVPSTP